MRRSLSVRWVLLLLAVIATACASAGAPAVSGGTGSPSGPGVSGPSGGQPSPSSQGVPGAVPEILDFEGLLVGGGTLRGAELAGAPVAIWFWAPW